jgi:non-ribosomal peptide synthetase component F
MFVLAGLGVGKESIRLPSQLGLLDDVLTRTKARLIVLGNPGALIATLPIGFDVSVWEFFLPLMNGASLVLAHPNGHQDPAYLLQCINDNAVTITHFVPSMLQAGGHYE